MTNGIIGYNSSVHFKVIPSIVALPHKHIGYVQMGQITAFYRSCSTDVAVLPSPLCHSTLGKHTVHTLSSLNQESVISKLYY